MTRSYHRAAIAGEIMEGCSRGVMVNRWPVLLARSDGNILAVIDRCSHAAAALSIGRIRDGMVVCPLHFATFSLATGKAVGGAYPTLMIFEVRLNDDWIEVSVPDEPPRSHQLPIRAG